MTPTTDPYQTLRRRAEDILATNAGPAAQTRDDMAAEPLQQLIHKLQVQQIELEMQNDQLRQTQVELDTARARYFDLYELAPVGYCTVNEQGLILESNLTAAALLGVLRKDLIEKPIRRFVVQADQPTYDQCRLALFTANVPQECELQMRKSDDSIIWTHIKTTTASDDAGARVQRLVLSDITERKNAEAALHEQNCELEISRSNAEKANRAKSEFLSQMSHELRSPLHAILGFAQLMELGTPAPSPSQKSNVDQILKSGWHLLELINEILDLSRIESSNLAIVLEPVALPDILRDCQAMIEPLAKGRGIQTHFPEFKGTCQVDADPIRLKQVLINLMANAIKYNRQGGAIDVTCDAAPGHHLRIKVRDAGEGLSEQAMTQLFQPFNRLGQERKDTDGTGIGLVLSKQLVSLMGGTIGVQSTVGVGSVFWIELKLSDNSSNGAS